MGYRVHAVRGPRHRPTYPNPHQHDPASGAERSKRAEILGSEGTKQADINIAQAKRQAQILEAEGNQQKQVILAEAQGKAFTMIETELKTEKGKLATQFIMGQRYIEALAK